MCKVPLCKLWLTINIFYILRITKPAVLLASQSSLCESMDMPCAHDIPKTCQMKYYKLNSTDCRDLAFNDKFTSSGDGALGMVYIHSFYYNILSYRMTAFNVTFSDIKWNHLQFRFKQIGNELKNTCREFFFLTNATKNELFYDCIWSNETYEGKPFTLEYEASNHLSRIYKKFSFHVPLAKNIDEMNTHCENWEVFTYVEALSFSVSLGPTTFYLHWQPLPKKFLVKTYNVSVISDDDGSSKIIEMINVTCINASDCRYIYSKWYGNVQFAVQPICNNTLGSTTKTLYFQLSGEKAKSLIFGIVCLTFLVPGALYLLFLMRKYAAVREKLITKPMPRLLVIYSPMISCHVKVVFALVEYLREQCKIEPLIDELHIFSSKSRDPFKWCNESMELANYVMVIASPLTRCKQQSDSVYKNVDVLLLRLLREKLVTHNEKPKFFVLMLPYSKDEDVPSEAQNLRRFYFPRDLNNMLRFIRNEGILPRLLFSKVEGGKDDYKAYGKTLSKEILEVQSYLKNNKIESGAGNPENDEEIHACYKCLTLKKRTSSRPYSMTVISKERLRELAKSTFAEFPGDLQNIALSDEEERLVDAGFTSDNRFDLNELDL